MTPFRHRPRRQRGISLVVALVLLLVVTLLSLGSMRGVVLQTRMSAGTHDRNLAFQAAEVALREAEQRAAAATATSVPASGCNDGYCAMPALNATPPWLNSAFAGWRTATAAAPADADAVVQDMGESASNWLGCENDTTPSPNCPAHRYVVTARSTAAGRATVIVQSQVAVP